MLEKMNPHSLLVGIHTGTVTMENSMVIPQKIKNRVTPKTQNIYSQRYLHLYVHCSIIHHGQDMQTKVSSIEGMVHIPWNTTQTK